MVFDVLELVGMAAGLIAAALFIRHLEGGALVGAAVVALAIGPFVLRAAVRALRSRS
jgi:hypothetical protein